MSIKIEFHLDTRTSNEVITVQSHFKERAKAAKNIHSRIKEIARKDSAILKVQDADTGDFVMINTMKLANVVVREGE